MLKCDCGNEFRGVFEGAAKIHKIQFFRSKPYSPWMNGKVERFWREFSRFKSGLHNSRSLVTTG